MDRNLQIRLSNAGLRAEILGKKTHKRISAKYPVLELRELSEFSAELRAIADEIDSIHKAAK